MSRCQRAAIRIVVTMLIGLCGGGGVLMAAEPLDQHGKQQQWRGEKSGVTVIDFAASWCLPCIKSLPRLDRLATENPDVTFIVVSVDKKESGRDFLVEELNLEVPVLWDANYTISNHYSPEGMPTTIVLRDGRETHRHTGFSERQWRDLVSLVKAGAEKPIP